MRYTSLRAVATTALALFGCVMGGIAWDELVSGLPEPDGFMIPFLGLPAFFASMAWLIRHLRTVLSPSADGRPRWTGGGLALTMFFVPGSAFYVVSQVLRSPRVTLRGSVRCAWLGWAVSCAGMQVSMIAELAGASPTITYDGLYAAFGVLNALVVTVLMWIPPEASSRCVTRAS